MAAAIRGIRILALAVKGRDNGARHQCGVNLDLLALDPGPRQAHSRVSRLNQRNALATARQLPGERVPILSHAPRA